MAQGGLDQGESSPCPRSRLNRPALSSDNADIPAHIRPEVHMLSRLAKFMSGSGRTSHAAEFYRHRLAVYQSELDEPEYSFTDTAERRIDIHAFGRDFVPACEE